MTKTDWIIADLFCLNSHTCVFMSSGSANISDLTPKRFINNNLKLDMFP